MTSEESTDREIAEAQHLGAYADGYAAAVEDLADRIRETDLGTDEVTVRWLEAHGERI